MSTSLSQRLLRGMSATALGQVVTLLVQALQVYFFIRIWGVEKNGEWLTLSSIPASLLLTDLGFGAAAASDMAMKVGRDDRAGALVTMQSVWRLTCVLSLGLFVVGLAILYGLPWPDWLRLNLINRDEALWAGLFLLGQVVLQQQLSVVASAFKSDGLYARCMTWENWIRLLAFLVGLGGVMAGGGPAVFAGLNLLVFMLGVAGMAWDLQRMRPWIEWSFRVADWTALQTLWKPALSFIALPAGYALSQQGFLLAIQMTLGPAAVTVFGALRTLSRVIVQGASLLSGPMWVELSGAVGRDDYDSARRLHRTLTQTALIAAGVLTLPILLFGEWIYLHWTSQSEPFVAGAFWWLVAVAALNSFWNASSQVHVAINQHQRMTLLFLVLNLGAVATCVWAADKFGLPGAAASLILVEVGMAAFVLPRSLAMLRDSFPDWARAMATNPLRQFRSFGA